MKTRYVQSLNGKLILDEQEKNIGVHSRGLKRLLNNNQVSINKKIGHNIYDLHINELNEDVIVAIFDLVSSGDKCDLAKKRIQIKPYESDFDYRNLISIVIYNYEPLVYAYLPNNEFINNERKSLNSQWFFLYPFVLRQRSKYDIEYICNFDHEAKRLKSQNAIYLFDNFEKLISSVTEDKFNGLVRITFLDKEVIEVKKEIKEFINTNLIAQKTENVIVSNIENYYKTVSENLCTNVAKHFSGYKVNSLLAEEMVLNQIKNNVSFRKTIIYKTGIEKLEDIIWVNEENESYLPYDICINNEIYIDVKATWKYEEKTFHISDNELKFRNNLVKEGKKYLIILVSEMIENKKVKFDIYNIDDLEKLEQKVNIIYIIKPFRIFYVLISNDWHLYNRNQCRKRNGSTTPNSRLP